MEAVEVEGMAAAAAAVAAALMPLGKFWWFRRCVDDRFRVSVNNGWWSGRGGMSPRTRRIGRRSFPGSTTATVVH